MDFFSGGGTSGFTPNIIWDDNGDELPTGDQIASQQFYRQQHGVFDHIISEGTSVWCDSTMSAVRPNSQHAFNVASANALLRSWHQKFKSALPLLQEMCNLTMYNEQSDFRDWIAALMDDNHLVNLFDGDTDDQPQTVIDFPRHKKNDGTRLGLLLLTGNDRTFNVAVPQPPGTRDLRECVPWVNRHSAMKLIKLYGPSMATYPFDAMHQVAAHRPVPVVNVYTKYHEELLSGMALKFALCRDQVDPANALTLTIPRSMTLENGVTYSSTTYSIQGPLKFKAAIGGNCDRTITLGGRSSTTCLTKRYGYFEKHRNGDGGIGQIIDLDSDTITVSLQENGNPKSIELLPDVDNYE